jgi:hypothetical protein
LVSVKPHQSKAPPEPPCVIGENGNLGQVLLEEIVDPASMGLTARLLVDDTEATEAVGDLANRLGVGDRIGANIIEAKEVGKKVQLAAVEEPNSRCDWRRRRGGHLRSEALLLKRRRCVEHRVDGTVFI